MGGDVDEGLWRCLIGWRSQCGWGGGEGLWCCLTGLRSGVGVGWREEWCVWLAGWVGGWRMVWGGVFMGGWGIQGFDWAE